MAYYEFQPFGEYREDVRHGIKAALAANTARDSRKHPKPFTPIDFMPFVKRDEDNPVNSFRKSMAHLVRKKDG